MMTFKISINNSSAYFDKKQFLIKFIVNFSNKHKNAHLKLQKKLSS